MQTECSSDLFGLVRGIFGIEISHKRRRRYTERAVELSWQLFVNALVSGLLLGGFYAAVAVGITIAFGMLDIVNIAHPAFIVLGAFIACYLNTAFDIDPLLSATLSAPLAYIGGRALYRSYYYAFERRGEESLHGLAFFFGLLFIVEVGLLLVFGADYRFVEAPYIGPTFSAGFVSVPSATMVSPTRCGTSRRETQGTQPA